MLYSITEGRTSDPWKSATVHLNPLNTRSNVSHNSDAFNPYYVVLLSRYATQQTDKDIDDLNDINGNQEASGLSTRLPA